MHFDSTKETTIMMVPMKCGNKQRRDLIKSVWLLLIKNTAYRPESGVAVNAMAALCKMPNKDLDTLGVILLTKRNEV